MAAAIAALCIAGCHGSNDDWPREPIAGQITLDGRPLERGLIQFLPADPGSPTPTHVGAIINDGRYDIRRVEGPVPGRYKVSISSGSVTATPESVEELPGIAKKGRPPRDAIPPSYNVATTLEAVVKADQENQFDFELSSK